MNRPTCIANFIQHFHGAEVVNSRIQTNLIQHQNLILLGKLIQRIHLWGNVAGRDDRLPRSNGHAGNLRVKKSWHHGDDQVRRLNPFIAGG